MNYAQVMHLYRGLVHSRVGKFNQKLLMLIHILRRRIDCPLTPAHMDQLHFYQKVIQNA